VPGFRAQPTRACRRFGRQAYEIDSHAEKRSRLRMKTRPPPKSSPPLPVHRPAEGSVFPMQQLSHAAMGIAGPADQGRFGSEVIKNDGGAVAPRSRETSGHRMRSARSSYIEPFGGLSGSRSRGPGSSDNYPVQAKRPRPTDAASSNLVVTEYALPRGGEREVTCWW